MEPVQTITGQAMPLPLANVDTDQIIPKQFLKRVERSGFGEYLFYDWARDAEGEPDPEFILNDPAYQNAAVLVAGPNFGSGSSREHAPWSLEDWGFDAVIAPSFADIFYSNCTKIGLLPVVLTTEEVAKVLGLRSGTLANMRIRGDGPHFLKLGSRVFYDPRDIDDWINESRRTSTSDDGRNFFAG